MNHALTGASAADFGMDSMFASSRSVSAYSDLCNIDVYHVCCRHRQRQTLADEDAPPMTSVNDIPNEVYDMSTSRRAPAVGFHII